MYDAIEDSGGLVCAFYIRYDSILKKPLDKYMLFYKC